MMKTAVFSLVLVALSVAVCYGQKQPSRAYPSADELPEREYLPDPFKFFGTDRYVQDLKDWKQRQAQIKEMLIHYLIGSPIPHYYDDQEVVEVTTQEVSEHKVSIYDADLRLGPPDKKMSYQFRYYLPNSERPVPIILRIHTTKELEKLEDTIPHFAPRGYGLAQLRTGKMPTDLHLEIEKNNQNRVAWTISEVIHYLDKSHQIDKVILTGYSRSYDAALATYVDILRRNADAASCRSSEDVTVCQQSRSPASGSPCCRSPKTEVRHTNYGSI
jgi:hypothetical protein